MFNIDVTSSIPIYIQIIDSVKEAILKGILSPGEKLPSVRELARTLTINPNTIQKAYQELERQKVIVTVRGRGTFISDNYKPNMDKERMSKLEDLLKKCIVEAHYIGVRKDDIILMIEELFEELERGR
ncbi:transcriptional regulator, GntR family [Gottschalkia purinilytica]|uniref:Transcriptional regulator, GntR family n=1 Tax=Gottschalkia purinilytica TaxID=1503 RepID=A0A0L0WDH1_GOTPU|nr:GntR family transcriptional regulator [Gottschalkia purinilytica]KNF09523.1 transcriptional regulator, GntR family [Gottschalkia purinilytica]